MRAPGDGDRPVPIGDDPEGRVVAALARLTALGIQVRDATLLARALTHPSYAHEHPGEPHHEALAFLGDAVLGLAVGEALYRADAAAGPGLLTTRRAALVSARGLAGWARTLGLGPCLRLGRGEEQGGGRDKESILASSLEAVVGALYLDGGLGAVEGLVRRLMPAADVPGSSGE